MSDSANIDYEALNLATSSVTLNPNIDPKTGWSVIGAAAFVQSLEVANDANPRCWSFQNPDSGAYLNVGSITCLSLYADGRVGLAIDRTSLSPEQTAVFDQHVTDDTYKSEPDISFIRTSDDPETIRKMIESFRDAHLAAIRSITPKWKINSRWRWHVENVREELQRISGEQLPVPGYKEQLEAYIESKVSTSSNLSGMYSEQFLRQMVRTITHAHKLSDRSWSLFKTNNRVALMVGQETVGGSPTNGKYELVIDEDVLPDDVRDSVQSSVKKKSSAGKNNHELTFLKLPDSARPDSTSEEVLAQLEESHFRALEKLTEIYKTATVWQDHDDQLRQQLESATGELIPKPAYVIAPEPADGRRYWAFRPVYTGINRALRVEIGRDQSVVGIDSHSWTGQISFDELPSNEEDFKRALIQVEGYSRGNSEPAWRFRHEVSIGDPAVLIHRDRAIRWGEITGDYFLEPEATVWQHRRPVSWELAINRPIALLPDDLGQRLWSKGGEDPNELSNGEFSTLTGFDFDGTTDIDDPLPPAVLRDFVNLHFAKAGLTYTDAQIAMFYTALQTKGFVVLSGISGTGKTRIAQGFVELLPSPGRGDSPAVLDEGAISFSLKPYSKKYKRVILPVGQLSVLPSIPAGSSVRVRTVLGNVSDRCRIEHRVHTNGNPLHVLYFTGAIGKAIQDLPLDTPLYLRPDVDDEGELIQLDLLTSMPTLEGKSSPLTRDVINNHLFLSVRPDWRDSSSLLGYYNPLTQTYEWTEFLRFVLQAVGSFQRGEPTAWFVVLDEMNLAHVEYYFADLLSVTESGRQDGTTGDLEGFSKVPLRTTYPDNMEVDAVPPQEIYLPPNLYVIGTVNMDETTHAFSPKVLDRAFTIELSTVDFGVYPPTTEGETGCKPSESEQRSLLDAFTRQGRFHGIDKGEIADVVKVHPEIRSRLQTLNSLLAKDRAHFGYRIFDEIGQYLANSDINQMATFDQAFDQAVFMKVLPKFSGSRARLRTPLLNLLAWAIDPDDMAKLKSNAIVTEFETYFDGSSETLATRAETAKLPTLAARTLEMLTHLERDGFVAFG